MAQVSLGKQLVAAAAWCWSPLGAALCSITAARRSAGRRRRSARPAGGAGRDRAGRSRRRMRERIEAVGTTLADRRSTSCRWPPGRVAAIDAAPGPAGRDGRCPGPTRRRDGAGRGEPRRAPRCARPSWRSSGRASSEQQHRRAGDGRRAARRRSTARRRGSTARRSSSPTAPSGRRSPAWSGCAGSTSARGSTTRPC